MKKAGNPGRKARAFKLLDQDGEKVTLAQFKGKWVVLYFYPKDNTPGCTAEAKDFSDALESFHQLNAEVLGISPDSIESHIAFRKKHKLKVRLLSDPERKVLSLYGAWGKKKLYGRTVEGVIRTTVLIDPEGRVVKTWPKVKVKGHVQDVLSTLRDKIKLRR